MPHDREMGAGGMARVIFDDRRELVEIGKGWKYPSLLSLRK